MEFLKKKLEILKDKNLYLFLAVTLIFFGIFIIKDYTIDSYIFFQETWKEPFLHFLDLGRIVTAMLWLIVSWTNYDIFYIVSIIIAFITTTLSMYELNKILEKDISNKNITKIISIIAIINFCTLELYMFVEKGIMMLSVLMIILAIKHLDKALEGDKKSNIIILIEMFIANCCYQGTVGLFVVFGTFYIIKHSKKIIDFIKNNVIVALLYAIPAILNYLIVKVMFNSERVTNSIPLGTKLDQISYAVKNILENTFGILPKYMFISMVILFAAIFIVKTLYNKEKINMKICNIFWVFYIIIATILSAVAPQIMQSYVYIVPRNTYPLGALIAIIIMLLYYKYKNGKVLNIMTTTISIAFLCVLFFNFMDINIGHYYTNRKDMEIAKEIATIVENYEKESGKQITKVVLYDGGENKKTEYEGVRYIGNANTRAFYATWGVQGILDNVLHRQITIEDKKDEEIEKYFSNQNWKYFNEDQVKIKDDTLHLLVISEIT